MSNYSTSTASADFPSRLLNEVKTEAGAMVADANSCLNVLPLGSHLQQIYPHSCTGVLVKKTPNKWAMSPTVAITFQHQAWGTFSSIGHLLFIQTRSHMRTAGSDSNRRMLGSAGSNRLREADGTQPTLYLLQPSCSSLTGHLNALTTDNPFCLTQAAFHTSPGYLHQPG